MTRTVLLIEDEPDIREVAAASLGHVGGFNVVVASDGAEGVAKAKTEKPDVILLDVMMPGIDGPATLHVLRADPDTADTPVIFLTAKAKPADRDRLLSLGASGVIAKPFDPMRLAADVTRMMAW